MNGAFINVQVTHDVICTGAFPYRQRCLILNSALTRSQIVPLLLNPRGCGIIDFQKRFQILTSKTPGQLFTLPQSILNEPRLSGSDLYPACMRGSAINCPSQTVVFGRVPESTIWFCREIFTELPVLIHFPLGERRSQIFNIGFQPRPRDFFRFSDFFFLDYIL